MDIKLIISKLDKYIKAEKGVGIAEYLGISTSAVSNWKARNSLNVKLILTKCESWLNPDWLLTGEGPMLKGDQKETTYNMVNEPEPTYGKKMIALEEGDYKEIMKKLDQQQKDIEVHQASLEALQCN